MQSSTSNGIPRRKRYAASGPRSHGACVPCKASHLKCDEKKPRCTRCVRLVKLCEYKLPSDQKNTLGIKPLRIRPTEQLSRPTIEVIRPTGKFDENSYASKSQASTWHKFKVVNSGQQWTKALPVTTLVAASIDPPNLFVLDMPLKSGELFHYYHSSSPIIKFDPEQSKDYLHNIIDKPDAFRDIILIAGVHFAWKTGKLQQFEPTFLFHKLQTIRTVNNWLNGTNSSVVITAIVRHIATLCFAELCLGDLASVNAHIDGMIGLASHLNQMSGNGIDILQQELCNRYVIFTYASVVGIKGAIKEYLRFANISQNPYQVAQKIILNSMDDVTRAECFTDGLFSKLAALRLLPSLMQPISSEFTAGEIDAYDTIACLHNLTMKIDQAKSGFESNADATKAAFCVAWREGHASKMLAQYMFSHTQSSQNKRKPRTPGSDSRTLWCVMYITTTFYLHHILEISGPGTIQANATRFLVDLLQRDISRMLERKSITSETNHLLFWQLIVGAISLHFTELPAESRSELVKFFNFNLQKWGRRNVVTKWSDAERVLRSVVWPDGPETLSLPRSVWENALAG